MLARFLPERGFSLSNFLDHKRLGSLPVCGKLVSMDMPVRFQFSGVGVQAYHFSHLKP
jgi:hypothetical protein